MMFFRQRTHIASLSFLLTGLTAAAAPSGAWGGERAGLIPVAGVRAKEACIKEDVRITGFAAAREASGASLPAPGYRVTEILVAEGDRVSTNQDLLHAVRDGGEAGSAASGAKSGIVSLRSPISGVITKLNARIGEVSGAAPTTAAQGSQPEPQVEIAVGSGLDLIADVPSVYAAQIRKGAIARILSDSGAQAKGVVQAPAGEIDPISQLGRARLSIDPPSALRSGQFASATIETAQDCGVTVPLSAVSHRGASATVLVLQGSSFERRAIRTGLSDQRRVRVSDGLSDGEIVAIQAEMPLRPGDAIAPSLIDAKDDAY